MRPLTTTVGPLAGASAAYYVASATPVSGTALTLVHTTTPDVPRRLSVAYGSEGSARTLVVIGTMQLNGPLVTETIAIPAGGGGSPVQSVLDYYSILSITPAGGGFTAAITIGTNAVASSTWLRLDNYGFPQCALQVDVIGTANFTVEQSLEDPNDPQSGVTPATMVWLPHSVLAAQTASAQNNYAYVPLWTRCTLNSGSGSCKYTVVQAVSPLRI